jgi:hypothetical protein
VPEAVVAIEDLFQESPVGTSGEGAKVCSSVTAQILRGYAENDGTNAVQSRDQSGHVISSSSTSAAQFVWAIHVL